MNDYRKLKAMLHDELDRIADKDELNMQSLEMVDKIAHSLKCIETVQAMEEAYPEHDGMSYKRRRDSMGRYEYDRRY